MTTAIARPGTPFPMIESDSYFNMPSSTPASSSVSRHYTQPIHFQLPTRTVLTPPSLLKRASSSGSSSSSNYHLRRTPSASTLVNTPTTPVLTRSRRESQCSSCESGSSPVMPTTPMILEDVFGEDEATTGSSTESFELPEPLYTPTKSQTQIQNVQNEATKTFSVKKFKPTLETITQQEPQNPKPTISMTLMLPPPTFTRPVLQRRDTPRPKNEMPSMSPFWDQPILSPIEEVRPRRKLTSLVDGLSWIVVE